ncbi:MAG: pyruvate kinase [Candidatus Omnitrophica bacterium]|nr:pyruvate kinase [Candidatus Omnitrophota bacterium]
MNHVDIIATLGPASLDDKILRKMIRAGVDIFRINMSHQTPQSMKETCLKIRRQESKEGKKGSILIDLQGPRMRTGKLKQGKPVELKEKHKVRLRVSGQPGSEKILTSPDKTILKMAAPRRSLFIDNGLLELGILRVDKKKKEILCRILTGGVLGENKGINLPGVPFPASVFTGKDRKDLRAALKMNIDWIALSFVKSIDEINKLKKEIRCYRKKIPVMAKIERPEPVRHFESILNNVEGVMVARGDLGIEVGYEKVPLIQKELIRKANQRDVYTVTATEMLESMIRKPRPTRAEASDVANAVLDGTDAVMLSGETAVGKYPVRAVKTMKRIIQLVQRYQKEGRIRL